jgi:hypothetical protein
MSKKWYDGEEVVNEATPKSPQLLYDWAEYHFNFSKEKVRLIMSAHNLTHFKPDSWWTYTELVRQTWEDEQAKNEYPEDCPICGAPTERNRGRDGLFGMKYGWMCTANRFHFMQERVNALRAKQYANSIRNADQQVTDERPDHSSGISSPESVGPVATAT